MWNPIIWIWNWLDALGNGFFGFLASAMAMLYANMGIMISLTFAALILLRPVTNRLIAPRWRVWVWFIGWYCGFLVQVYSWLSRIRLLPVSFRSLIVPRTFDYGGFESSMPMFLPEAHKAGDYAVFLPGGVEIPVRLSGAVIALVGLAWLISTACVLIWTGRKEKELKAIGRQGVKMDAGQRAQYGIYQENIVVRLCKDLPTSFVRFGNDESFGDGTRFVICVQDDLPEDKMRLVLMHEMEHIRQHHAWWKSTLTYVLFLFWWNPLLWVAHRLTCRDMELACDEAVMEKLDAADRRAYAHTLVELGAGRHIWGVATSFGECDAALRVKNVIRWKPRTEAKDAFSLLLVVFLVLFFYTGSQADAAAQERMEGLNWTWFANGSALELSLEERLDRELAVEEVWEDLSAAEEGEHTVLVRVDTGEWYSCWCVPNGFGSYKVLIAAPSAGPGPDLTNYLGIVIHADVFKALYG